MSHFVDGFCMLCYGVLLKGDKLSQIIDMKFDVSTWTKCYFVNY